MVAYKFFLMFYGILLPSYAMCICFISFDYYTSYMYFKKFASLVSLRISSLGRFDDSYTGTVCLKLLLWI